MPSLRGAERLIDLNPDISGVLDDVAMDMVEQDRSFPLPGGKDPQD